MAAFSNQIHLVHSPALLSFSRDGKRAKMTGGLRRSYIPMTMIEKLAINMAMEAKAARSRMKSVIGRLPFPLCSYNVLFMFMRQVATANLRPARNGDGKHFSPSLAARQSGIWTQAGPPISLRLKCKSGDD
ncbi:hypothetical protein [Rhizobium sp. PL01]|uniref:hypothetical protein n=1 Tax=Rhizobium sp. PL01 TaxID=3085631 RepID=UPI002981BE9E|nr:hypothetical protein [Rhizobium sp. PL01]MDW5317715.1 hypothetical protein [Rhizobium sp. PL01]